MTSQSERIKPGFGFARARAQAFAALRHLWRQRRDEGWSQVELAGRLGRDAAWVSRKLSGPTNLTLRTFGDLADALDGEIEIRLGDLQSPGFNKQNYDAYLDYSDDGGEALQPLKPRTGTNNKTLPVVLHL
jgi:transcriptional regulator with XRE-family HTH domain